MNRNFHIRPTQGRVSIIRQKYEFHRQKYECQSAFTFPQPVRETLVSTLMFYIRVYTYIYYFFDSKTGKCVSCLGPFAISKNAY
jgi:hypothetical protein